MFGNYNLVNNNNLIEAVDVRSTEDQRYTTAGSDGVTVIDTPLMRVYINADTYFSSVPESVWKAAFTGEPSPEQFLVNKIGQKLESEDVKFFQALLSDLIDAEFAAKTRS